MLQGSNHLKSTSRPKKSTKKHIKKQLVKKSTKKHMCFLKALCTSTAHTHTHTHTTFVHRRIAREHHPMNLFLRPPPRTTYLEVPFAECALLLFVRVLVEYSAEVWRRVNVVLVHPLAEVVRDIVPPAEEQSVIQPCSMRDTRQSNRTHNSADALFSCFWLVC